MVKRDTLYCVLIEEDYVEETEYGLRCEIDYDDSDTITEVEKAEDTEDTWCRMYGEMIKLASHFIDEHEGAKVRYILDSEIRILYPAEPGVIRMHKILIDVRTKDGKSGW